MILFVIILFLLWADYKTTFSFDMHIIYFFLAKFIIMSILWQFIDFNILFIGLIAIILNLYFSF